MTKDEHIKILQDEIDQAFWTFQYYRIPSLKFRINQLEGQKRLEKEPYELVERLFDGRGDGDE